MSNCTVDDETKLKDALAEKLENCGYLAELRAQLTAKIHQTLDTDIAWNADSELVEVLPKSTVTLCLQPYLQSEEGTLALYLVRDMLDSLGLHYTSTIFRTEIGGDGEKLFRNSGSYEEIRRRIRCSVDDSGHETERNDEAATRPLLVELLHNVLKQQPQGGGSGKTG